MITRYDMQGRNLRNVYNGVASVSTMNFDVFLLDLAPLL